MSRGQSVLEPHSSPAHDIATLWWGMLAAAGIVLAGVLLLMALSIVRRRREGGMPLAGSDDKKLGALVVGFGIVIPVITLSVLFFIADIGVVNATDAPTSGQTKFTIHVVARQWFWEARYPGGAVTANEIHIPARTPVNVVVSSPDVIHSFWAPELNKKVDAIPGHPNSLYLYANEPGVYRGQCAEFCGLQHAKMALAVYADPPQRYRAWLQNMSKPVAAATARSPGFQAFARNQCASCHTIAGTSANGRIGPDLTHLMSRETIGALTLPNTPSNLGAWVLNPQRFKPGNKMPGLQVSKQDFTRIMSFLRSLK